MRITKALLPRLGLGLLAVALALGALEAGLRLVKRSDSLVIWQRDRPSVKFFPGTQRLNPWSKGHPDPLRIAVVGDSITQASGCQYQDAYGMRLEALLNLNDNQRPAEVRIWARGGNSTHDELAYLTEILPWKPQLLILGICLNDTEDFRRKKELNDWRQLTIPAPPPARLAGIVRHSRAAAFLYQKAANRKARRAHMDYYRRLYDKEYSGWRHFVEAIRTFNDTCREENIVFLPVIFPLISDLNPYPFEWVHQQIGALLEEEQIQHLDLLGVFRGRLPDRLQVIPNVDAHPNEIAHRIAAEAIFKFLLANRLIDDGYLPAHASASPKRLWRMLSRFVYNAAAADAAEVEQLRERDEPGE